MHCHAHARLTPRGRATVFEVVEARMPVTAACLGGARQSPLLLPHAAALAGEPGRRFRRSEPPAAPTHTPVGLPGSLTCGAANESQLGSRSDRRHLRCASIDGPPGPPSSRAHRSPARTRRGRPLRARRAGWTASSRHQEARPHRRWARPSGDRRSTRSPARCRLGGAPRRHRRCQPGSSTLSCRPTSGRPPRRACWCVPCAGSGPSSAALSCHPLVQGNLI